MKLLKGKSVIITGAARGLGFAASRECLVCGAYLAMVDFNREGLGNAVEELKKEFPQAKILPIVADVSNEQEVKGYVDKVVEVYGRIDGFYNNAGIEGKLTPFHEYDVELFKKVLDINVMGVVYGLRHVLPVMKEQGYGRVVNVSSVGGIRATVRHSAYVASKHAVAGVTKSAALEYGKFGVVVNAVAPGLIKTQMAEEALWMMNPENPDAAEKLFCDRNPVGRLGKPEEIAAVVVFLLGEKCSYLNGHILVVDGGESNVFGPI